jgi:hypothetical protein
MKRRGWRVALTVATLGLALVAGLVAFNWAIVRDHAEAWWFVATRETKTIEPNSPNPGPFAEQLFHVAAGVSGCQVIFAPKETGGWVRVESADPRVKRGGYSFTGNFSIKGSIWELLEAEGYRVLEQRFPRRAYVVVGYPPARSAAHWVGE